MEEGHGYKDQINANGDYLNRTSNALRLRSDGSLQSICYEQICQGCTDEVYFQCAKCEAIPYAFSYGTKYNKYLLFAMEDYTEIMNHYVDFLMKVIDSSSKTLFCSQEIHTLFKKMFGGKHFLDAYLNVALTISSPIVKKSLELHVTPSIGTTGNSLKRTKLSMQKNQISYSMKSENTSTFILSALMVWIWLA